jgi:site-specific DNA-methyltransferase (adenine-specific)
MAVFENRFKSTRQDWNTPKSLFDPLNNEFKFTLDAAASADNALAPKFFTELDNSLQQDWGQHIVWLNPPYGSTSKLSSWVQKSYHSSLSGATVTMLIPARTNTVWFHDLCLRHAEVRFIKGRPKFGDAIHGLPQPLCIVVFRPPQIESNISKI